VHHLQVRTYQLFLKLVLNSASRIRKVKCDEARPSCIRCTSTGRKCDGYAGQPYATALSAGVKLHVSVSEYRALDFFCRRVAAAIAGTLDPEAFWTRTVHQASQNEPAVRHAVVASMIDSFL
jgi:hypothetical protein